ncbi:MAG TPA: sigma-70 family RNA polymerase sigma factor [Planctomycetaceae bacterium]|nr:sigma-70 family RNA polymerase sigma factor [Planctomycetaceae bacterium]
MGGTNWPTTSVRLVAAVRTPEDRSAWNRFSDEYGPALLEFCQRRGLQSADAEDVVQTVFLGVHRTAGGFDYSPDRGRFRSWLSTIALRAIWKLRQREWARQYELQSPAELDHLAGPHQVVLEELNASVTDLAVDVIRPEFDDPTWEAFSSIWLRGEKPQGVAARIGRSAGWVYKAKFKVLERLKSVVRRIAHELDQF